MNAIDLDISFDIAKSSNSYRSGSKQAEQSESGFQNVLDGSISSINDKVENEPKSEKSEMPKEAVEPRGETEAVEKQANETIVPIENVESVSKNSEDELSGTLVVPMKDLIAKMELDEEQVQMLAEMLNITVDELKELKVEVNLDALKKLQTVFNPESGKNPAANILPKLDSILNATLEDGTEVDFNALLGLDAEEAFPSDPNVIVEKIAKVLGVSKEQADLMVKELKIDKIEIKTVENTETNRIAAISEETKGEGPFLRKDAANAKVTSKSIDKIVNESIDEENFEAATDNVANKADTNIVESAKTETAKIVTTKIDPIENTALRPAPQSSADFETKIREIKDVRSIASETSAKIMNQIVEKAKIISFPEHTEARLILNPKQLGSIDIKIMVHDAQVKGQIVVENQQIKQIVEQNLDQLKSAMSEQGVELQEISVEVSNKETKQGGNEMGDREARQFAGSDSSTQNGVEELAEANRAIEIENMRKAASNSIVYLKA